MSSALDRLSPRERRLLWIALPTLALVAGWTFVWQPLAAGRAAIEADISEARTLIAAVERFPKDEASEARPPSSVETPISTRLTRSAEAAGVTLARIEPQGAGLTAIVTSAPFDDIIAWIAAMEDTERMRLTEIELDRRPELGVVSARLTMVPRE